MSSRSILLHLKASDVGYKQSILKQPSPACNAIQRCIHASILWKASQASGFTPMIYVDPRCDASLAVSALLLPARRCIRWSLAGISELGVALHIRRNPSSCTRTRLVVKRCEHAAQASRAHRATARGQDALHNVRARPGPWDAHVLAVQGDSRCCNSMARSVPAACGIIRPQVRVHLSQLTPIAAFSCPQHQPRQVHRGRHHHQQGRPHHQLASQHAAFIGRVRVAQQVNSACTRALFAPYTGRLAHGYRSTRGSEDARVSTGRSSRCWEHSTWHLSFVRQ